jgi:hypothetical protein
MVAAYLVMGYCVITTDIKWKQFFIILYDDNLSFEKMMRYIRNINL